MLRVRTLEKGNFIKDKIEHYSHLEFNQAMKLFFPHKYTYKHVNVNEEADICIVGIQHNDNKLIRENEFNVLITVENLSVGRTHYNHYNKFNKYGNNMINLYYYNDVNCINYNTIPNILCFIRQYNNLNHFYNMNNIYNNILNTKFKDKRFCLLISNNNLNSNKKRIINHLSIFGKIDHISGYNKYIGNTSCYNSIELLKIFNFYKFVICFENSKTNGYITEKIFNIFLAKSIPIYDGAPNICSYINNESFIKYDNNYIKKVLILLNNEKLYNCILNNSKINTNIDMLDFEQKIEYIFDYNLNNKNIIPKE